ncbi:MAG: hypothetical protein WDO17_15605 [Alphaproteobacteria bacterium]
MTGTYRGSGGLPVAARSGPPPSSSPSSSGASLNCIHGWQATNSGGDMQLAPEAPHGGDDRGWLPVHETGHKREGIARLAGMDEALERGFHPRIDVRMRLVAVIVRLLPQVCRPRDAGGALGGRRRAAEAEAVFPHLRADVLNRSHGRLLN